MNPTNTGSFGAATGGTDALKASMQRRGMDASILDQTSASSPAGLSEVAPAMPSPSGGGLPETDIATKAMGSGGKTPSTPFRSGEGELALKALADTLKIEGKIAQASLGLR